MLTTKMEYSDLDDTLRWNIRDIVLQLSLVVFVFYTNTIWYIQIPLVILIALAIFHRKLFVSGYFWGAIASFLTIALIANWFIYDNHQFLIVYWAWVIYLSFWSKQQSEYIKHNARLLIGLAFFFAAFWKATTSDYTDGSFMTFILMTDRRFRGINILFGLQSLETWTANHQVLREYLQSVPPLPPLELPSTPSIRAVGYFLTWSALIFEAIIATAFILPERLIPRFFRHILLMLFITTTYILAPVIGFGAILTVMGIAQTHKNDKSLRLTYALLFIVLQLYGIPWQDFVAPLP